MGKLFSRNVSSPTVRQWIPEPPILPYPQASGSIASIDGPGERSMAIPAVWGCVTLIANSVSIMPFNAYTLGGNEVPMRMKVQPDLLTMPDFNVTSSEWVHMIMLSLLLRGNGYGQIIDSDERTNFPSRITLLNPDAVQIIKTHTGDVLYRVRDLAGNSTVHTAYGSGDGTQDIWHVKGMTMPGSIIGMSPIAYAAAAMGVDIKSRKFADDFFGDSQIPKAVLESDQTINQEQAETIKQRVIAAMTSRKPMVLGAGVKFTQLNVKPEESQFLQTQMFSIAQIARFYLVPPEMIGGEAGHSLTYSNREQRSLDFLTYCVAFWLKRIEDSMSFIMPKDIAVRFDTDALLRTDAETTAAVDIQRIAAKVKTPTEIRARMGLEPMNEAQKEEVDLVPLVTNVIGGSKLGVKVNTSIEQQMNPTKPNFTNVDETGNPKGAK